MLYDLATVLRAFEVDVPALLPFVEILEGLATYFGSHAQASILSHDKSFIDLRILIINCELLAANMEGSPRGVVREILSRWLLPVPGLVLYWLSQVEKPRDFHIPELMVRQMHHIVLDLYTDVHKSDITTVS